MGLWDGVSANVTTHAFHSRLRTRRGPHYSRLRHIIVRRHGGRRKGVVVVRVICTFGTAKNRAPERADAAHVCDNLRCSRALGICSQVLALVGHLEALNALRVYGLERVSAGALDDGNVAQGRVEDVGRVLKHGARLHARAQRRVLLLTVVAGIDKKGKQVTKIA